MDHCFAFISVADIASLPSLVSVRRLHGGEAVLDNNRLRDERESRKYTPADYWLALLS